MAYFLGLDVSVRHLAQLRPERLAPCHCRRGPPPGGNPAPDVDRRDRLPLGQRTCRRGRVIPDLQEH